MESILSASLVFPSVLFSLLLSLVLVYWMFVVLGALDIHLFDLDADVGTDLGGDLDADADADAHGTFSDILARLDLTEIPLTVSISLFALLSWFGCVVIVQWLGPVVTTLIFGSALAIGAAAISLFATSQVAVFLKPIFATHAAPRRSSLIGKTCRITTLTVSAKHGQAEVDDGGAGLVIQVRSSNPDELTQGSEALIFNYDAKAEIFSVKPLRHA